MFVHPRTVDIDCVGDRPRRISTPLVPATEKHINWLHWEPCLVTMAKHTGRGGGGVLRWGSGFTMQSLRGCLSLFSFPPAMSVILSGSSQLAASLSHCPLYTHQHYLHIFHIRLLNDADLNNVPLTHLPLPCPTVQQCHLPSCIFFPQHPLSLLSVRMCSVSYMFYY